MIAIKESKQLQIMNQISKSQQQQQQQQKQQQQQQQQNEVIETKECMNSCNNRLIGWTVNQQPD